MSSNGDPTYKTKARVKLEPPAQVDVAIIGAGLGGLQAAAILSLQGLKVACFDQHYVAGGCCTQFSRGGPRARYNFDIGLHYIGDCAEDGLIPRLLKEVGVELDYVPMDQDGYDELIFPDLRFRMPVGHDNLRQRMLEFFPAEKKGIDRYIRFLKEIDAIVRKLDQKEGRMDMGFAMHAMLKGRLAAKYQGVTLKEFLDSCTNDPKLQGIMAGQNGDYGLPPSRVSAALHAGLTNHYIHGAYYPVGGGQVIADRLAEVIEDSGGTVHLRRGIEEILVENGQAIGVRTETYKGQQFEVRAKQVISNADLKRTLTDMLDPKHLPAEWITKPDNMEMAAGIFMTCLGVEGSMAELGMGATNYWQFDHYDFDAAYANPGIEPFAAYITSASMKEPNSTHHAPTGISNVECMTVLPGNTKAWGLDNGSADHWDYKRSDCYQELKAKVEDDMIQRLENLFPGAEERIVFKESASPMSHIRFTRASDGTGYGLACTPEQYLRNRPGYRGPIDKLYFCGASTKAGHGVLGALKSGQQVAKRVLADRASAAA